MTRLVRILFLDIDGVLLSGRAWLLPANRRLQAKLTTMAGQGGTELIAAEAVFDPVAVELVNRVAEATGTQIVVSSNWRYRPGPRKTRCKLLEQGIRAELMHRDWFCVTASQFLKDKATDISRWLQAHPDVSDYLAIDDEADLVPGRTLPVDPLDGLGPREAAAAIRFFGAGHVALGVGALPPGDHEMVIAKHGGDRVSAAMWLEGVPVRLTRRHRPSFVLGSTRHGGMELRDWLRAI
ncbi:hypothetical protein EBE87_07235 [Pseudoroseomonas wenyumeiae]|uniref:HAD family hydrolase n=1 Tax=Teichococcus wenyumeiae TaxID=2478470 RepID=A0A3A9JC87_9PROT|nr:HAD domain-containing protein [Pseudoroseomonas wenyumeiae]RKK04927.1 hypothetical protein D6Z83_07010 [Pseudoroseomonas wenyumeiae]RMI26158.1 hypothetical protein EBE87_07235 [Pseudoroseomonas wenyumeiae]